MKNKKSLILGTCLIIGVVCISGCSHQKPDLAPTQTVEGKSIVVPPEFNVIPESAASEE